MYYVFILFDFSFARPLDLTSPPFPFHSKGAKNVDSWFEAVDQSLDKWVSMVVIVANWTNWEPQQLLQSLLVVGNLIPQLESHRMGLSATKHDQTWGLPKPKWLNLACQKNVSGSRCFPPKKGPFFSVRYQTLASSTLSWSKWLKGWNS